MFLSFFVSVSFLCKRDLLLVAMLISNCLGLYLKLFLTSFGIVFPISCPYTIYPDFVLSPTK